MKNRYTTYLEMLAECERSWHGEEGIRRRERVKNLVEKVCREYGDAFGLTKGQIFASLEAERTYSAVNYYQEANFPALNGVTIYDDLAHFQSVVGDRGFRCPRCKHVSKNPYECDSGAEMEPGKRCDWKSYGLFRCLDGGHTALLRSEFPKHVRPVTIFKPVSLEDKNATP